MNNAVAQSGVMGVMCALFGGFVGLGVLGQFSGKGYEAFPLLSAGASFLTGAVLWWLIVARTGHPGIWRGMLAGVLAALGGHYVTWYLFIVLQNAKYRLLGTVSSLGDAPIGLVDGLWGAVALTFFSYLFVGFLTVPSGAIIGGLYGWFLKHRLVL